MSVCVCVCVRPYGARRCGCCVYVCVCVCARVRVQPRMGVAVLALHFLLFLEGAIVFVALLGRESQGPPRCPAWVQSTLDLLCAILEGIWIHFWASGSHFLAS